LPHSWTLPMVDATGAYLDGRCDEALRLADEAQVMARASGIASEMRILAFRYVLLWQRESDDDHLAVIAGQLFAHLGGHPGAALTGRLFVAYAEARLGRPEHARALLEEFQDQMPPLMLEGHLMAELMVEVCHAIGVRGRIMEHAYAQLMVAGSTFFTLGVYAFAIGGPLARGRALVADALGLHDEAEAHFEQALRDCEASGYELFTARSRADFGAFLLRSGQPERAEPLLREAATAGERLGMAGLVARTRALLGDAAPVESASEQAARAARHSLAELAAGIAHEINSPLGALRSNAELAKRALDVIREAMSDPELSQVMGKHAKLTRALDALGSLHRVTPEATERIHSVVSELRSFARLDRAEVDEIDLRTSLDEALRLLAHRTDGRIEVKRSYRELPRLRCHPERLNEALLTVLGTAIDRIDGQGALELVATCDANAITLEILHGGDAFTAAEVARLFSPNLRRGGDGGAVGLRLGMPIARQTIEDHGGSLEVETHTTGRGCFKLWLPLTGSVSDG